MPTLRTSSSGGIAYLVTFTWESGDAVRLTQWPQSLVVDGQTYASTPMSVRYGEENGSTDDAPAEIDLLDSVYPIDLLGAGYVFARVWCSIQEYLIGGIPVETWYGMVGSVRVNPSNIRGVLRARIDGVKSLLEVPLSVAGDTDCKHARFGNLGCGFDVSTVTYDAVISEVNTDGRDRRATLDFDGSPSLSDAVWRYGILRVGGAAAQIRRSLGDGRFDLVQRPHPSWLNAECTAQEGCDRTLGRCTQLGNTPRRLALGIAIPDYNPTLTTKG